MNDQYRVLADGLKLKRDTKVPGKYWDLGLTFVDVHNALVAGQLYFVNFGIDRDEIVTVANDMTGKCYWSSGVTSSTEGEQVQPDLENPLLIPRTALVERLQENLDEETKQRETVEAKERQARLAVTQFITDHEDEIVEWIGRGGPWGRGSWEETAKQMERFFADNDYKPARNRKSSRENELEKFVRVLSMATNETVEVKPNQPIYDLL